MADFHRAEVPDCTPPLRPSPMGGWDLVLDLAELSKPLDPEALFGRRAPLEIEIGVGSGLFTSRYACDHPDRDLLGLDVSGREVYRTNDKCRRSGVLNVRLIRCDAVYFLEDYPPESSVDAFHVYYPDPWPKRRHHRRRLFQPRFLTALERTMKPGASLHFKTDVTDYFEAAGKVLSQAGFLALADERRLDREPLEGDYPTNYQSKAIEQGHPLHYQSWRRS